MRSSVAAAVACLFAGRAVLAQEATRPPIQSVEIKPNRAIYVNGQSFLPIMAWLQNPSNFEIMKSCGMNTATGYAGRSGGQRDVKGYLDLAQKAGLYGVMPFDESLKGHPALLGYIHGDEPDLPSKTSDTMVPRAMPSRTLERYQAIKASDSSRPVFMTLTGNFHPFFKKWSDEQRNNLYPAYIKATDIVGYDIYPIYGWNKPEWIHLVYEATALLTDLSKPRPVYAWIETSKGSRWTGELERQKEVTGEHIRAEVWMAICGGATVIGYFTHIWKPSYVQFGVPQANREALADINAQLTRLAPHILGNAPQRAVSVTSDAGAKLALLARQSGSDLYIFAVNYDERLKAAKATFSVAGLKSGTRISVVDENRTIGAGAGTFDDNFAPLAVHIYKLAQ